MRLFPALLCVAGAAVSTVPAQTQEFGLWPGGSCGSSRANFGASAGDLLTGVDGADLRGVGQTSNAAGLTVGRVNAFRVTIQDQSASTTEAFSFAILPEDPAAAGAPDPNPANELLRTSSLTTPPGTGAMAWSITGTLATPADVVPSNSTFFFGTGLAANAAWPTDGASVHLAGYPPSMLPCGDNPRPGSPNVTFQITRPAGAVSQPAGSTFEHFLATEGDVLNAGQDVALAFQINVNPSFGVGGLYPDTSTTPGRRDGLVLRYRATPPGTVTIMLAAGWGPGFALPFATGDYLLDPQTHVSLAPFAHAGGEVVVPLVVQGGVPLAVQGRIHWQLVALSAAGLRFTNGTVIDID